MKRIIESLPSLCLEDLSKSSNEDIEISNILSNLLIFS